MGNPITNWIRRWFERHRRPVNLALHAVGIPAIIAAIPFAILQMWGWAALLFFGGYALQFLGHILEGNQSGEEQLFRRIVGGEKPRP